MSLLLLVRTLVIGGMILGAAGATVWTQSRTSQDSSRAVIMGRVLEHETKAPIPGVVVSLLAEAGGAPVVPSARTNHAGVFVLAGVPPGNWRLIPNKPGFRSPRTRAQLPITAAPGHVFTDVVLTLTPYRQVTGTITDEHGEPLANVTVRLFSRSSPGEWSARSTETDDRGRYLFDLLSARDCYVAVTSSPGTINAGQLADLVASGAAVPASSFATSLAQFVQAARDRPAELIQLDGAVLRRDSVPLPPRLGRDGRLYAYGTTFYPSSPTPAGAQLIVVDTEDVDGIDIALAPVVVASVSGVIQSPTPPPGPLHLSLALQAEEGPSISIANTITDPTGRFHFPAVPAGRYLLRAAERWLPEAPAVERSTVETGAERLSTVSGVGPDRLVPDVATPLDRGFYGSQMVDVTSSGLRDLIVPVAPGIRIRGRLEFDGTSPVPTGAGFRPFSVQFWAYDNGSTNYFSTNPDAQGRFVSPSLPPGRYTLRAFASGSPWVMRGFRLDGPALSDRPVRVSTDVDDAAIVLTDRLPVIGGRVRLDSGDPAAGVTVLLFPADRARWAYVTQNNPFATTETSLAGTFSFGRQVPRDYYLIAVREPPPPLWDTPDTLAALATRATRVTAREGERLSIQLVAFDATQLASCSDGVFGVSCEEASDVGASVAGTVVDAMSGRLLSQATVTLTPSSGLPRSVMTGVDGAFMLTDVPPGRTRVSASRPGYLALEHGAIRPNGAGVTLLVGTSPRDLEPLRLTRGAEISGTVRDQSGDPLARASVRLMVVRQVRGETVLVPAPGATPAPAVTDTRGRYRIYNLPSGEYHVGVTTTGNIPALDTTDAVVAWARARTAGLGQTAALPPGQAQLAPGPTFHPGAAVFAGSQPVRVSAGEARTGIDVQIAMMIASTVRGTVVLANGQPARAGLVLIPKGPHIPGAGMLLGLRGEASSYGGAVRVTASEAGQFRMSRVPAGAYTLVATAKEADGTTAFAMEQVLVTDVDSEPIVLTLGSGYRVEGSLVVAQEPTSPFDLSGVRISATGLPDPSSGNLTISPPPIALGPDRQFTVRGVIPGRYALSVLGLPHGLALRAVTVNGVNAIDTGVAVQSGDVAVRLEVTSRPSSLSGRLLDARDLPATEYVIVALPRDRTLWSSPANRVRAIRPREDGEFTFEALLPGEYLVCALTDLPPDVLEDPNWLDRIARAGLTVIIRDGERTRQDLRIAR
jgi:hypothetical protein